MSSDKNLLYRGVSHEMHEKNRGLLIPKNLERFSLPPEFGVAEYGESFWSDCAENAVLRHQLHQKGLPTSGISTTPLINRAIFYATHNRNTKGWIYVIDRSLLNAYHIDTYDVNKIITTPSVPCDQEVVLVNNKNSHFESAIIVKKYKCDIDGTLT
jgi:hypothetical protein